MIQLQTERLTLIPLGIKFLQSTHEYAGNLENARYMVHLPNQHIDETRSFLYLVQAEWEKEEPSFYEFAILLEEVHIGTVDIEVNREAAECELGWIINKKYWGHGYAVEAAKEVMRFAIEELKTKRFIAHCDSENVNSYRVMEKLGMRLVEKTGGRRNKGSDEEREELLYAVEIDE